MYSQTETADETARLRAAAGPLILWYEKNKRDLPWRKDPTPYHVWISEIMLQQTRIEAAKPYYERFIARFPDIPALAAADEDSLLTLWQGLGYYSRAKNLKKSAGIVTERYGGELPADREELLRLPGIGSYTAGAIASIAFGKPVPAVDGNVLRVLARLFADTADITRTAVKRRWEKVLGSVIPRENPASFNQGLFEVGELLCVPNGEPKCRDCPLKPWCLAQRDGNAYLFPQRSPKKSRRVQKRTVVVLLAGDRVALHKRPEEGLLASLYEFPNVEGSLSEKELASAFSFDEREVLSIERLPDAKHVFTHMEWRMSAYRVCLQGAVPGKWISAKSSEIRTKYALPSAFSAYEGSIFQNEDPPLEK